MKLNSNLIEYYVAQLFGIRSNYIVPNISWGLGLHECDLLIVRMKTGYAIEVEIKMSLQDLKNDLLKPHGHKDKRIKQLFYAMPEKLIKYAINLLDENIGLISIKEVTDYFHTEPYFKAFYERPAKTCKYAVPLTEKEMFQLLRLGCMRIWKYKKQIVPKQKKIKKEFTLNLFKNGR